MSDLGQEREALAERLEACSTAWVTQQQHDAILDTVISWSDDRVRAALAVREEAGKGAIPPIRLTDEQNPWGSPLLLSATENGQDVLQAVGIPPTANLAGKRLTRRDSQ